MAQTWKEILKDQIAPDVRSQLDGWEAELELKKQNKMEDKVFMESRGRYGIYGQRYDNTLRHNGKKEYKIQFPGQLTKGPGIHWHAPGMQRIKLPSGVITARQLEVMAELAEDYGDAIVHITTRQDVQIHYIHIEDTTDIFRRLAAVGITSKEACGNSVRNVTACPLSGVCHDEEFDASNYARALTWFLLGHDDVQDFGRKFKIAFSGCADHPCALTHMHDLGFIARHRIENGTKKLGFTMQVGGGLGAVPHVAKTLFEFLPEEELFPMTQAVCRIFARYGEKEKRARARVKFLVAEKGIEEFRRLVEEERKVLKPDARWDKFLEMARGEKPDAVLKGPGKTDADYPERKTDKDFSLWLATNVRAQKQPGYSVVTVKLPLGDLTSNQSRDLAEISRKYIVDSMRTTVEQNIVMRWVSNDDIPALYRDLKAIHLGDSGAGTILDITSCPGTDTCKLGVSSSRGLSAVLSRQLAEKSFQLDQSVSELKIKVSGCFNSCGMHHIADIGFYGVSRAQDDYVIPHFQMVLGGSMKENAGAYGLAVASIPSKAIPQAVDRLTTFYAQEREKNENFQQFVARIGKPKLKDLVEDLRQVPAYEADKSFYVDWGDVREYSTGDKGIGECSGEIISLSQMGLKNADRDVFAAQVELDKGDAARAAQMAFSSMHRAAHAILKAYNPDMEDDIDKVYTEFSEKILKSGKFLESNANYYVAAIKDRNRKADKELAHRYVEEAQLFIEEAHSYDIKRMQSSVVPA